MDSLLYRFASRATPWGKLEIDPLVHFLISEEREPKTGSLFPSLPCQDGRGLAGGLESMEAGQTPAAQPCSAGGNWIVRNSREGPERKPGILFPLLCFGFGGQGEPS